MHSIRAFEQPILVGHHSERAHRRDLAQDQLDRAGFDEYQRSKDPARIADSAALFEAARTSVLRTPRWITRLEAEIRPAPG